MTRDEHGRFVPGNGGGPGRPSKSRETRYLDVLLNTVSFEDWKEIVSKANEQAKRGDAVARKWLSDYLIGAPVQRTEVTGAEGGPLVVKWVDPVEQG